MESYLYNFQLEKSDTETMDWILNDFEAGWNRKDEKWEISFSSFNELRMFCLLVESPVTIDHDRNMITVHN